jgi:hypothetical protein
MASPALAAADSIPAAEEEGEREPTPPGQAIDPTPQEEQEIGLASRALE